MKFSSSPGLRLPDLPQSRYFPSMHTHQPSWFTSLTRHLGQWMPLLVVVSCTALLSVYTLNLQHSSTPLLEWTTPPSTDSAPSPPLSKREIATSSGSPQPAPSTEPINPVSDPGRASPDLKGATAGAVIAAGMAVAGAPVTVLAGVGFLTWLVVRTVLSSGS